MLNGSNERDCGNSSTVTLTVVSLVDVNTWRYSSTSRICTVNLLAHGQSFKHTDWFLQIGAVNLLLDGHSFQHTW